MIAIDIGNSNIVVGVFQDQDMTASWRFATDHERMPDEWWSLLSTLAADRNVRLRDVSGAIISSVVPRITPKITDMIRERIGVEPILVSVQLDLGIGVQFDNPEEVGADRIVNAVAVRELYRSPAIVVDFGTATTFDIVSSEGNYIGGAIAPGVQLALEALTGRAARLTAVQLVLPPRAIGSNTIHGVQSGTVLGYLELVNGMLRRIIDELGGDPAIVATGGLGELFHANSPLIEAYEPDLTLHGLRLIYENLKRG